MKPEKIRVLVAGLLTLCLLSLIWMDGYERVIGLTELVAASGAWTCSVWLWNRSYVVQVGRSFGKRARSIVRSTLIFVWTVILCVTGVCSLILIGMYVLEKGPFSKEAEQERRERKLERALKPLMEHYMNNNL